MHFLWGKSGSIVFKFGPLYFLLYNLNMPKVLFRKNSISQEVKWLYLFIFENSWGWSRWIFKKHPDLKEVLKISKPKDRKRFINNYIIKFRKDNEKKIENSIKKYKNIWSKKENKYYQILEKIIGTNFPKNKKKIIAFISINPICPRFLEDWSFSIFYNFKDKKYVAEVIMHEICHFLYFKKWKEIFPHINKKKFESPYIEWHLSEIIAPIILNDKRIQKILKQRAVFYPEHSNIRIGDKSAPEYFNKKYIKIIKETQSFEVFLKDSYEDILNKKYLFNNP